MALAPGAADQAVMGLLRGMHISRPNQCFCKSKSGPPDKHVETADVAGSPRPHGEGRHPVPRSSSPGYFLETDVSVSGWSPCPLSQPRASRGVVLQQKELGAQGSGLRAGEPH